MTGTCLECIVHGKEPQCIDIAERNRLLEMAAAIRSYREALHMKRENVADKLRANLEGDGILEKFPSIRSYLTDNKWDDGSERATSTLLAFAEDGMVKVCLNDRHNSRSAWASGKNMQAAMESLESALEADCVEWRGSKGRGPAGRGEPIPY